MWIESHQSIARHPKVMRLASALCIHKAQAIGHLHLLWWWAIDYAADGDLSQFSDAEIAGAAEWKKDPAAFVQAMTDARLIDADRTIHDWHGYSGRLLNMRRKDAERKRDIRRTSSGHPADIQRTSSGHPADIQRTADVQDSTGHNSTGQDNTIPDKTVAERGVFTPPTLDECKASFVESGSTPDKAEVFWNFYSSNGWKVGKNKMRSWKHAVAGWISRDKQGSQHGRTTSSGNGSAGGVNARNAAMGITEDDVERKGREIVEALEARRLRQLQERGPVQGTLPGTP